MKAAVRYALFWALCFSAAISQAQTLVEIDFNARHARIDSLMAAEAYSAALPLLDRQIEVARAANAADSLYAYVYNLGRAAWKVNGAADGIARVEDVIRYLETADAGPYHLLKAYEALSWIFYEAGFPERCIETDLKYFEICESWKEAPSDLRSIAAYNLGYDYMSSGNWKESVHYFKRSIEPLLADSAGDPMGLIQSYNALGAAWIRTGNFREAREAFGHSLTHMEDIDDPFERVTNRANVLGNLSLIADYEGDVVESKDLVHEALALRRRALDLDAPAWKTDQQLKLIGTGYHNLAALYLRIGDFSRAREALNHERRHKINIYGPNHPELAKTLEAAGNLHLALQEFDSARIALQENLEACLHHFGKNSYYTGVAYMRLAKLHLQTGRASESLSDCDAAIEILKATAGREKTPDLAECFLIRAKVRGRAGDLEGALRDADRAALTFSASRGDIDFGRGRALAARAELLDHFGDSEGALAAADSALFVYTARLEELRAGNGTDVSEAMHLPGLHHLRSCLLLKLGDRPAALDELETAVAALRSGKRYYDTDESRLFLFEDHAQIFESGVALLYSEYAQSGDAEMLNRMFALAEEGRTVLLRGRLAGFSSLKPGAVPDSLVRREQRLIGMLTGRSGFEEEGFDFFEVEEEYRALQVKFAEEYPTYHRLRYEDQAVAISEVQQDILKPETTLIRYVIAGDSLYSICISSDQAMAICLPAENLDQDIAAFNAAVVGRNDAAFRKNAKRLYERLLEPLRSFIAGNEVLIVPDRALFDLNFETLIDPASGRMVIEDFTVSYLHSVTTAMQFKYLTASAAFGKSAAGSAVAFAPGFSDEVKRVYAAASGDSIATDSDYFLRIRQPFAEATAHSVASLFPGKAHIGTDATETRFKAEADRYGIIHLGTHTEINNLSPLMSRLVLTKSTEGTDDGYLHAYEIYNLGLRAELAVLTACETGAGKVSGSEGVLSLAHSFAYAGVPSIVMTLWQVDEKTSAEVIESFYEYIADGMPKNEALRRAKLDFMAAHPGELSAPFYWSGLVLIGDGAPVSGTKSVSCWYWVALAALICLAIVAYVSRHRKAKGLIDFKT